MFVGLEFMRDVAMMSNLVEESDDGEEEVWRWRVWWWRRWGFEKTWGVNDDEGKPYIIKNYLIFWYEFLGVDEGGEGIMGMIF